MPPLLWLVLSPTANTAAASITIKIDFSTVVSTFDMDQLGKIHRYYCKECLVKIGEIAKFQSDMS